jgi:hypothetical protein
VILRTLFVAVSLVASIGARAADPRSDAPDARIVAAIATPAPPSYDAALRSWRGAGDVNDWIGSHFAYDAPRSMLLSETQRGAARLAIHRPEDFYAEPSGVCVDLARFGVETLRAIDPGARPFYLMLEFAPLEIAGNVLRRHWMAGFERGGHRWFFADSKRPGHLAGPYEGTKAFVDEYAAYRHREVVAFRELESYERATRTFATKRVRDGGAIPP